METAETRLPSLNSLMVFEVAARNMSFTTAANELHVTQSAVSHRIKTLEEELGVRLFKRENTKLILTEEGEMLLPDLSRIFYQIREAIDGVKIKSKRQPLTIVLRPYFAQTWLLPRLPDFWAKHPEIDLHLIHSNQAPCFTTQHYDLAIQWTQQPSTDVEAVELVDGSLTAFCNPSILGNLTDIKDLSNFLLLDEDSPNNWNQWLSMAGLHSGSFAKRLSIDDTNVRIQAAMDGVGLVLTCPSLLNQRESVLPKLLAPFPDIRIYDYIYYLVCPKKSMIKKQVQVFMDWIVNQK